MMKHILLIDDNEIDSYIAQHVITKSKIAEKLSVQNSAIEALEFLELLKNNLEEFPDMVFLDIQMPKMNGFGFLEAFKKYPEHIHNQCKVVMLTSSNDKEDIKRSFQYPFVKKFITKPLKLTNLQEL